MNENLAQKKFKEEDDFYRKMFFKLLHKVGCKHSGECSTDLHQEVQVALPAIDDKRFETTNSQDIDEDSEDKLKPIGNFRSFICGIAYYKALEIKENCTSCNKGACELNFDVPEKKSTIESELENTLLIKKLREGLSKEDNSILDRYFWKGEKQIQIAEDLGISYAALRRRISRIYEKMREKSDQLNKSQNHKRKTRSAQKNG